jgi:hypothetical protein
LAAEVLFVTWLDHLARSTRDLLNTLAAIARARRALPFAWRRLGRHHHGARALDPDRARGAEFERELIRARDGIDCMMVPNQL